MPVQSTVTPPVATPTVQTSSRLITPTVQANSRLEKPTAQGDNQLITPTESISAQATTPAGISSATAGPAESTSSTAVAVVSPIVTQQAASADELRQVATIEAQAAQLRGLTPKAKVTEAFISHQQLHDNLVHDIARDYPRAQAQQDALEAWLLRLVDDPKIDLYQLQVDLLTEQVAGYYDPKAKDLFVLSGQSTLSPLSRMTLAHEYTHSLQDQYYDLTRLLPDKSTNPDRDSAVRSLVEGDASLSGFKYAANYFSQAEIQNMLKESGGASTTVLDRAPLYVREGLNFPYDEGVNFVNQLLKVDGFRAVDRAFASPPTSTEQIIHPEKYISTPRDEPVPVTIPPLTSTLGTGWTLKDSGTSGEFDARVELETGKAPNAKDASAGWGGGQYAFYLNGKDAVIVQSLAWDTTKDADEFDSAIRGTFSGMTANGTDRWSNQGRYFSVTRKGNLVTFIGATTQDIMQKATAALK
ncbi:MAG: hypothetical protein M3014_05695 [Chloroflexota bacterium]|nr:hypothetical protein [Chloroflexota bacterium]